MTQIIKRKMNNNIVTKYIIPIGLPVIAFITSVIIFGFFGGLSVALITALLCRTAICAISEFSCPLPEKKIVSFRSKKRDYLYILLYVLIVRIAVYALGYLFAKISGTVTGGFFESFRRIWVNSGIDAPHYLGLAENWYVTHGDPMYHIVFFPLFPILIKIFRFVFGSTLISALVLNFLLSCGIGIAAYELALADHDKSTALRFVKYIFIFPGAFFYAAPMTEPLFMLLCILCVLSAKKDKFVLAALFGALAAFTRMQGVLLALPCGYMALREYIINRKNKDSLTVFISKCLVLCGILIGTVGYLLINYSVWGDPFKFMVFQKEHWYQSLGFFGNTVKMIYEYMISGFKNNPFVFSQIKQPLGLWLPQLIFVIVSPVIVLSAVRTKKHIHVVMAEAQADTDEQMPADAEVNITLNSGNMTGIDPAYAFFFIAYYVISVGATWLLSAPRYLMACFTLPLSLAVISRGKVFDVIATAVTIALSAGFFFLYCASCPIY